MTVRIEFDPIKWEVNLNSTTMVVWGKLYYRICGSDGSVLHSGVEKECREIQIRQLATDVVNGSRPREAVLCDVSQYFVGIETCLAKKQSILREMVRIVNEIASKYSIKI